MPAFDEKFSLWLRESSAWVPLKVLLKANPDDLVAAGYPEAEVKAFLAAYHELEQAEAQLARPGPRGHRVGHARQFPEAR